MLLAFYRAFAELRRTRHDLTDPRLSRVSYEFDDLENGFVMHRGHTSVVVNFTAYLSRCRSATSCYSPRDDGVGTTSSEVVLPACSVAILPRWLEAEGSAAAELLCREFLEHHHRRDEERGAGIGKGS
jgi:hypothetical protein